MEAGRKLAQALTAATFHGDGKQMTALLKEAASKPGVALAALQVAALIASSTVKQAASLTGQDADLLLQAVFAAIEVELTQ